MSVKIVGDSELARSVNSAAPSNVDEVDADSSELDDQDGLLVKRVSLSTLLDFRVQLLVFQMMLLFALPTLIICYLLRLRLSTVFLTYPY